MPLHQIFRAFVSILFLQLATVFALRFVCNTVRSKRALLHSLAPALVSVMCRARRFPCRSDSDLSFNSRRSVRSFFPSPLIFDSDVTSEFTTAFLNCSRSFCSETARPSLVDPAHMVHKQPKKIALCSRHNPVKVFGSSRTCNASGSAPADRVREFVVNREGMKTRTDSPTSIVRLRRQSCGELPSRYVIIRIVKALKRENV